MSETRLVALTVLPALALVACAPGGDQRDKDEGSSPIGYELAYAREDAPVAPEASAPRVIDLSVEQLREKLASGDIRLIDVRTDEEVAQGMIPGAEHIALDRFDPSTLDLSDGREVVLYCRSGRRSGIAAEKLAGTTGKPAEHLAGGILAWEEAGEPVEQP